MLKSEFEFPKCCDGLIGEGGVTSGQDPVLILRGEEEGVEGGERMFVEGVKLKVELKSQLLRVKDASLYVDAVELASSDTGWEEGLRMGLPGGVSATDPKRRNGCTLILCCKHGRAAILFSGVILGGAAMCSCWLTSLFIVDSSS